MLKKIKSWFINQQQTQERIVQLEQEYENWTQERYELRTSNEKIFGEYNDFIKKLNKLCDNSTSYFYIWGLIKEKDPDIVNKHWYKETLFFAKGSYDAELNNWISFCENVRGVQKHCEYEEKRIADKILKLEGTIRETKGKNETLTLEVEELTKSNKEFEQENTDLKILLRQLAQHTSTEEGIVELQKYVKTNN